MNELLIQILDKLKDKNIEEIIVGVVGMAIIGIYYYIEVLKG